MTQMLTLPSAQHTLRQPVSPIHYACRITENCLLCSGPLRFQLDGAERIAVDGVAIEKPYFAARLSDATPPQMAMVLAAGQDDVLDSLQEVTLSHARGITHWRPEHRFDDKAEGFETFIASLPPKDRAKILFLLFKLGGRKSERMVDPSYIRLSRLNRLALEQSESPVSVCYQLAGNVLYVEAHLPRGDYTGARAIFSGTAPMRIGMMEVLDLAQNPDGNSHPTHAMLLVFKGSLPSDMAQWKLSLLLKDQVVPMQSLNPAQEIGIGNLIARLSKMPDMVRFTVRDFIVRSLIDHTAHHQISASSDSVRSLQYYLPATQTSVCTPQLPFGMNVETAIPLPGRGVFLSGWIYDPQQLLQSGLLLSDTGVTLPFVAGNERIARPDVSALYADSPFACERNNWGFATFIEYPAAVKKKQAGWPDPFSFRLSVQLKGGLRYTITPKSSRFDPFTARKNLMTCAADFLASGSHNEKTVTEVATRLQALAMKEIKQEYKETFGALPQNPIASVIIALDNSLDYLPAQLAHFAGDPAMRQAEIIYVLDRPAQKEATLEKLRALHALYDIPLSLLVLSRQAGFAMAINQGVAQARAAVLVIMQAGIIPTQYGWLEDLIFSLDSWPDAGIVAPKLMHEDDSISHAGLHFDRESATARYDTHSYFNGYPASYAPACINRPVPAVSTACAVVRTEQFLRAGQFSTDYAGSGYEDTDLCLKLHKLGATAHYCANVSLYHFTPPPAVDMAAQNAWRMLNKNRHHERWSSLIPEVMKHYA